MATYFVRADAPGTGDGSAASAASSWTWSQLMTALGATIAAGDVIYLVSAGGKFNLTSTDAPTRDGTVAAPILLLGCKSAAGDLDATTYKADGSLDDTDYPVVSYTGASGRIAFGVDYMIMQHIHWKVQDYNGTGVALGNNGAAIGCVFEHNGTGANVIVTGAGTIGDIIDCDFKMGGASGAYAAIDTGGGDITRCRFLTWRTRGVRVTSGSASVTGCLFRAGTGNAIEWQSTSTTLEGPSIKNNTIVGATIGISLPNAAHTRVLQIINNVIVNCTTAGIQSAYDATGQLAAIIRGNYFRNNGVNVDGYDTWLAGIAGTDNNVFATTGSDASDFASPGTNDYRIKTTSPAATAGTGGVPSGATGVEFARRERPRRP